jgi:O-acetyl-ADP-ribose deacetylase (regulator of RNase III)
LFLAPIDAAGHVANCQHTFGSGIARTIRELYPEVYAADCETFRGHKGKMGTFSLGVIKNPKAQLKAIYNLYGQFQFGNARDLNYEALYSALTEMRDDISGSELTSIGFPYKLGSDRAGGDWMVVESMIYSVFKDFPGNVLICVHPDYVDNYQSPFVKAGLIQP